MKHILGISAFYHDSAAALLSDGKIVAAAQEERFTRIKHDAAFPKKAVEFCLETAGISESELEAVVFYEKPLLKFERLLETYTAFAPTGLPSFMKALPIWIGQKLFLPKEIDKGLNDKFDGDLYFATHHGSHAASAFFPSPFEHAAIITFDGVGEWSTTTYGSGRGNKIELSKEIRFPHSLGLLYSAFTYYTGFRVNSGEYKLMGLAPYGEPKYVARIYEHLIDVKADGSFWLDQSYFNYCAGLTMTGKKFHSLFGKPPRSPETPVTQFEMDIAASIQKVTEDVMLKIVENVHRETNLDNLCLAGGVALNCVANGKILRESSFKNVWIQPAAGDAGGALGATLFAWHQILGNPRTVGASDSQSGTRLGPQFSNRQIKASLDTFAAKYDFYESENELCARVAELIAAGKVIGHFAGRMEFGPRALGGRSIIGDARNVEMQTTMNVKIKFRESFRPFAPSCLRERVGDYFELDTESPYMLIVAPIAEKHRIGNAADDDELFGIDKLKFRRSDIPAVTHVDYSARIQTVDAERNPRYYKIIKAFENLTGCAVIVNTSFNIRGEPIVCLPEEAYRCFMLTDMDALVLENYICLKENQPEMKGGEDYKKEFKLD